MINSTAVGFAKILSQFRLLQSTAFITKIKIN